MRLMHDGNEGDRKRGVATVIVEAGGSLGAAGLCPGL